MFCLQFLATKRRRKQPTTIAEATPLTDVSFVVQKLSENVSMCRILRSLGFFHGRQVVSDGLTREGVHKGVHLFRSLSTGVQWGLIHYMFNLNLLALPN